MAQPSYTPPLFITQPEQPEQRSDAPRCRMCARPARWVASRQDWGMYCGGDGGCPNRQRLCQACGADFIRNVDGAGTKYCSTDCKRRGYTIGYAGTSKILICAWGCGKEAPGWGRPQAIWPYICRPCLAPISHLAQRLKKHRVSHERARQLLDDPTCDNPGCGRDIVAKQWDSSTGRGKALLVVDHDHSCCPSAVSCGRCIRGLLCENCNFAAGQLGDDPNRARGLADYLTLSSLEVRNE